MKAIKQKKLKLSKSIYFINNNFKKLSIKRIIGKSH